MYISKFIKCCFAVLILLVSFGCNKAEEVPIATDVPQTEPEATTTEDNSKEEENVVVIPEVIDPNGTYLPEDATFACVIVPALRQRTSPGGEVVMLYDGHALHTEPLCYYENEIVVDDEYKWIRIAEDRWIGTTDEWIIEEEKSDYRTKYSLEERRTYTENYRQLACAELDRISEYYPMTEEEKEISWFLKKTIPGMWAGGGKVPLFDARNPSSEAIRDIFFNVYFCQGMNLSEEIYGFSPDEAVIEEYTKVEYEVLDSGIYSFLLQEHLDYFTERYYGNVIDFRNCGVGIDSSDGSGILYDAKNQCYGILIPSGIGLGQEEDFPFVLKYRIEDDYIFAEIAIADIFISESEKEPFWVWDMPNTHTGNDAVEFIKSEAPQYVATIRIAEDGSYQLITLQKKQ